MSKATIKSTQPETQGAVDWTAVGRRIRELRGFDMTQAEFARRVGVTQGHLSRLERGEKEPGAGVLLAISQEFRKSVDWLLTGKTHVEPKKRMAKDPPPLG
jgi:transcriptional regulator with XRE-family HTH domain